MPKFIIEPHFRLPEWVAEIRRLRDAGDTALFVAATPGRAERIIELLKEYELFAVPVDRADDARYAAVLVATGNLSRGFHLPDAGLHRQVGRFGGQQGKSDKQDDQQLLHSGRECTTRSWDVGK